MSSDKSFWMRILGGKAETNSREISSNEKKDSHGKKGVSVDLNAPEYAMEEGLKGLSWVTSSRAKISKIRKKTRESFGEEVGNALTHGVMALFMLGMLPFAAIRTSERAPQGSRTLDTITVSIFIICVFFMFLTSTIYHIMPFGTAHKRVTNRLDHIMIYFAIAGTYTPICLSVIGGALGLGLCIAQWTLVLAGTLFKSLAFSRSVKAWILTIGIYILMGWMVCLCMPALLSGATTPAFWLILSGGVCYTLGIVCFSMKFPFAHMVWHFFVDFGAICHFIAIVFFLR